LVVIKDARLSSNQSDCRKIAQFELSTNQIAGFDHVTIMWANIHDVIKNRKGKSRDHEKTGKNGILCSNKKTGSEQ